MSTTKQLKQFFPIIFRYLILILAGIPNLWIFYFIFTPLTVYAFYFLTGLFFNVLLIKGPTDIILINNNVPIEFVKACIAGSAYYLLLILNLSIPKIKINKRIKMILFSFLSFFIINILRIFLLTLVLLKSPLLFEKVHMFFWYFLSIVLVAGIWFVEVKMFKIKEIPFYSDLKFLTREVWKRKIKKKS